MFNSADAAVVTKMDIAEPCGFDRELALRNINEIRPGIRIFETSAKTGSGWRRGWGIWRKRERNRYTMYTWSRLWRRAAWFIFGSMAK